MSYGYLPAPTEGWPRGLVCAHCGADRLALLAPETWDPVPAGGVRLDISAECVGCGHVTTLIIRGRNDGRVRMAVFARKEVRKRLGEATVVGYGEPHPFADDGKGRCGVTIWSRNDNGGSICSEPPSAREHRSRVLILDTPR